MSDQKRVLIFGGTDGTGEIVANKLQERGWDVTVFARNAAKAKEKFGDQPISIIEGNITQRETLPDNLGRFDAIIHTAGVTERPVGSEKVRNIDYRGMKKILDTAREAEFGGRFIYMTPLGTERRSIVSMLVNIFLGKILMWRKAAEQAVRNSGLDYTIVRCGLLNDKPAGTHKLRLTTERLSLGPGTQMSREDAADVIVAALEDQRTVNAEFSVLHDEEGQRQEIETLFRRVA